MNIDSPGLMAAGFGCRSARALSIAGFVRYDGVLGTSARVGAFIEAAAGQAGRLVIAEAIVLTLLLGAADVATGSEFSFSIFYLLPISLVAWSLGRRWALANAGLASVTWLLADYLSGTVYSSVLFLYWNAAVRLGYFGLFAALFASLRSMLDRERDLSRVDSLTGLRNRRSFEELAALEVERMSRYGHPMSLAFVDLDHFKAVNDGFGHDAGDELLQIVADTLVSTLRTTDIVCRLGGDEFAIIMPETCEKGSRSALEKSRQTLAKRMSEKGWPVTLSAGVVASGTKSMSLQQLLSAADRLMYQAKQSGRDCIEVATADELSSPVAVAQEQDRAPADHVRPV